jgi:hypothetical protein
MARIVTVLSKEFPAAPGRFFRLMGISRKYDRSMTGKFG